MKNEPRYVTDIYRYDVGKDKWTKRKDYDQLTSFKFAGGEYCLTYKDGWYYVCSAFDDEDNRLYCLYKQKKTKNDVPGEIVSQFRKLYLKNNITTEKVKEFLIDPIKICPKP